MDTSSWVENELFKLHFQQQNATHWKPRVNNTRYDIWGQNGSNNIFWELFGNTSKAQRLSSDETPSGYSDVELDAGARSALITIYSLTTIFAVCGNVLVLLVLILGGRLKTELSVFLINLAAADLNMACFCMPFTFTQVMLGRWIWGKVMCPLVLFMQVWSVSVSIFTNVAIGLDRFWGVIYPLKQRLTKTKAKVVIGVIWITAFFIACPQLFIGRVEFIKQSRTYVHQCNERWPTRNMRHTYTIVVSNFTYLLPLLLLAFAYYKVGAKLWVRQAPGNVGQAHEHRDQLLKKSKQRVLKMVILVVISFACCWLPLHLFTLILDFAPHILDRITTPAHESIFVAIFYVCHWLAMANSFTNPIIFAFLNDNFRADLRMMCLCLPCVDGEPLSPADFALQRTLTTRWSVNSTWSRDPSRRSRHGSFGQSQRYHKTIRKRPQQQQQQHVMQNGNGEIIPLSNMTTPQTAERTPSQKSNVFFPDDASSIEQASNPWESRRCHSVASNGSAVSLSPKDSLSTYSSERGSGKLSSERGSGKSHSDVIMEISIDAIKQNIIREARQGSFRSSCSTPKDGAFNLPVVMEIDDNPDSPDNKGRMHKKPKCSPLAKRSPKKELKIKVDIVLHKGDKEQTEKSQETDKLVESENDAKNAAKCEEDKAKGENKREEESVKLLHSASVDDSDDKYPVFQITDYSSTSV